VDISKRGNLLWISDSISYLRKLSIGLMISEQGEKGKDSK